ncbi:AMP-binding protein, partial [Streptomyces flavochromogenes]|uniref:AMP-binding protein n=1 Tax=Streptomyces flavochromogenes TaxID=68199 RepID=UPI0005659BA5
DTAVGAPGLGDLRAEFVAPELRIAKFDLTFAFGERRTADGSPDGLDITVEYATDLYERSTAEAVAHRLTRLLTDAVADPDRPISRLALLGDEEDRRLTAWSGPATDAPRLGLDGLLNGVLEQVAPAALITQTHLPALSTSAVVVDLTAEIAEVSGLSGAPVETGGSPESVACVMFTSGSTGLPKGVMASHRALAATFVGPDYLAF